MAEAIRPGAALNDPGLRAAVDRQLSSSRRMLWSSVLIVPAIVTLPSGLMLTREAKRRRHVLANYPFQVYPCRVGRWVWKLGRRDESFKADVKHDLGFSGKVWQPELTWIQLLDPAGGQPLGGFHMSPGDLRVQVDYHGITPDATHVQFAGDVNAGGVFRGVDGTKVGVSALRRDRSRLLFVQYLETMSPDRPAGFSPEVGPIPTAGPWLADSPQPPTAPPPEPRPAPAKR